MRLAHGEGRKRHANRTGDGCDHGTGVSQKSCAWPVLIGKKKNRHKDRTRAMPDFFRRIAKGT